MAKRRTPPLFEVLTAPDRRPGPGAMVGRPVQVPPPREPEPTWPAANSGAAAPGTGIRLTPAVISLGVAALLVVIFGVWFFAFKMGEQKKAEDVKQFLDPNKGATNPTNPVNPLNPQNGTAAGNGSGVAQTPISEPEPAPDPLADPRKPGNNYLHIVTLESKEADRAVAYLTKNGVLAAVVPAKKAGNVDLASARAKNLPLLVFALEPIPSDQYKASERKRQDLVEKVRQVGKKWQREEKGPSDFGEPSWALFK